MWALGIIDWDLFFTWSSLTEGRTFFSCMAFGCFIFAVFEMRLAFLEGKGFFCMTMAYLHE
jgi:hypothetical protein